MKKIFALLTFALCFSISGICQKEYAPEQEIHKFKCQGIERSYLLYLPEDLPQGAPILFYLHGYNSKGLRYNEFCKLADKEKFAVCIPWAEIDPNGKRGWNVGYNMQQGYKVDDVKFLVKLAKYLHREYGLSDRNVFATGHSNGGEMCYLIAYREPSFFKAVAPLSGLTMKWMYRDLVPAKAIPLLEIHGTEDHTSEWNGDLDDEYWGPYIAVPVAVSNWAVAARCDHEITEELPLASPEAHKVVAHKYVSSDNGNIQVQLYEVIGCGHGLKTEDFDYHQTVWDFFKQYVE